MEYFYISEYDWNCNGVNTRLCFRTENIALWINDVGGYKYSVFEQLLTLAEVMSLL